MWVLEKILGIKQPVGVPAHRGVAVEDGVAYGLMHPDASLGDCLSVALIKYDTITAMSSDDRREKYRASITDMVAQALVELRPFGIPSRKQGFIEWRPDGLQLPIVGYFDFEWAQHGLIVDLKTTEKMPGEIKVGHARQISLYAMSDNYGAAAMYVTPKKSALYRLENAREHRNALYRTRVARRELPGAIGRSGVLPRRDGAGPGLVLLEQSCRAAARLRALAHLKFPANRDWLVPSRQGHLEKRKMSNVFGFSTESTGGGEFMAVLKYDARAGRFFRVDRVDTGNGFTNEQVDITAIFKAICDFENIEVGWIVFTPGSAPDFNLVPIGSQLPDRPSPVNHKNGLRFMLKLSKECGGDKPIREIAGTSKAFLSGIEAVYTAYLAEKGKNPGKLPVLTVDKITPVKTGTGAQSSTNYHPTFKIGGWAPRGDLVFAPKSTVVQASGIASASPGTAPSTGSTRAQAPAPSGHRNSEPDMVDSDFG